MIGKNSFTLNHATMKEAIQYYFDTVVFKDGTSPKVDSVKASATSNYELLFMVETESAAIDPKEVKKRVEP